jgi:hypothetical protein
MALMGVFEEKRLKLAKCLPINGVTDKQNCGRGNYKENGYDS